MRTLMILATGFVLACLPFSTQLGAAEDPPKAFIDGTGPGWKTLGEQDFQRANGDADSWVWTGADVHGTGLPIGVLRSKKMYANFEMVARWRQFGLFQIALFPYKRSQGNCLTLARSCRF